MIGKWTYIRGRQERLTLDEKEYEEIMNKLLENNIKEFERCLKKAKETFNSNADLQREVSLVDVAVILFDKQATASFSAITDALNRKEMAMKTGQRFVIPTKKPKDKSEEKSENEEEKSAIERGFEKSA